MEILARILADFASDPEPFAVMLDVSRSNHGAFVLVEREGKNERTFTAETPADLVAVYAAAEPGTGEPLARALMAVAGLKCDKCE